MPAQLPVSHSIISPDTIITDILPGYRLEDVSNFRLYSTGFNDTYQINTKTQGMFYFRIYRNSWRSKDDVACELEALDYLQKQGFPAAYPKPYSDGNLYLELEAPEGIRQAALFVLAPGSEPNYDEDPEEKATQYGRAVASLHNALTGFSSPHQRFHLDLEHFIHKPLRQIEPFLAQRLDLWEQIKRIAWVIHQRIIALPESSLEWGFCHGDLQGFHHRIAADGKMTFIDFDCGGFGFRAYDLAVFRWCARLKDSEAIWWQPYLRGYLELRQLNEMDLNAIPLFVGCRYIWHMGVHCENSPDWGCEWLNEAYFEEKVKFLNQVEVDYLR